MKPFRLSALLLSLCILAGCAASPSPAQTAESAAPTAEAAETTASQTALPETTALPKDLPPVDIDLTVMNQTMMYAQAYDMIYNSEQYIGKTVRIRGPFNTYTDTETGEVHRAILIRDATACCTQGIEFEPADPDVSTPAIDTELTVSGTFDTYMNDMFLYCVLRNAAVEG